jgi:hypothetical protein
MSKLPFASDHKTKLGFIGINLSQLRYYIVLSQASCPSCRQFPTRWATHFFCEEWKPVRCHYCRAPDPWSDFYDPLEEMIDCVREGKKYKIPDFVKFLPHLKDKAYRLNM